MSNPPAALVSLEEFVSHEYDFVICGGGTAGLVLAARLTEDPDTTVGVIEAGNSKLNDPNVDIPALFGACLNNPDYDWAYKSVPQKFNNGKIHHIPRGRALGGSSAINFLVYVRGQSQEYDDWAEIANDSTWSGENVKKYMAKHQSIQPMDTGIKDRSARPYLRDNHGTVGPIKTSFNGDSMPIEDAGLRAAAELTDLNVRPKDPWDGNHMGFYHGQATISRTGSDKGQRSYAASGYFLPASDRPNLKVLTDATVVKILLEGNTAKGVEFIHHGSRHTVAAKEVLVCGGVIGSPHMLQLSGIGNPEILRKAGIDCLIDLPSVGSDMQDHAMTILLQELAPGVMSGDSLRKPEVIAAAQQAFAEHQAGPLTGAMLACGYFPAKLYLDEDELEEVVKLLMEGPFESEFQKKQMEQTARQIMSDDSANFYFSVSPITPNLDAISDQSKLMAQLPLDAPDGVMWCCSLQFCGSRGYVHVKSSDPFQHPEINPRYSSHPADLILRGAGMRFLDDLIKADALKGLVGKRTWPPESSDLSKREARRAAAKELVLGQYHLVGTCAMGHTLDSKLRVKGVDGLRVVDCSIFPGHVSGNTVGTVYALAELAADIIKEDWRMKV